MRPIAAGRRPLGVLRAMPLALERDGITSSYAIAKALNEPRCGDRPLRALECPYGD